MRSYVLLCVVLSMLSLLGGCTFYEKAYVSRIELEGRNYRGSKGDEGVFYIDDDPLVRIRMGCHQRTVLGDTVSVLIPLPIIGEASPHESIARQRFTLTLSHQERERIDLSTSSITVAVAGTTHVLRLRNVMTPKHTYRIEYEYISDLSCGDIKKGTLEIALAAEKTRVYGVEFTEGVVRDIDYRLFLTT